jgi:microcompartment protein CcmL/EutN
MPKALGLIETRGLVAAIEAADAMVKAANVKIVGKEQTNPALITIKIVGDVAAVKSAVDAGAAAAQKVGELVSIHVIPQPDIQMLSLFPELDDDYSPVFEPDEIQTTPQISNTEEQDLSINTEAIKEKIEQHPSEHIKRNASPQKEIIPEVSHKEATPKVKSKVIQSELEVKHDSNTIGNLFTAHNDTISRLRQEALGKTKKTSPQAQKEDMNGPQSEEVESLNVHQLRRLARDTENFPIKGREISKANRQELIEFFRKQS